MNAAGVVCGPARAGIEMVIVDAGGGLRLVDRRVVPYPPDLRAVLERLEAGQPAGDGELLAVHQALGRVLAEALRGGEMAGSLGAAAVRGYAAAGHSTANLFLGDLCLAGAAGLPVAACVEPDALACAGRAAALLRPGPPPGAAAEAATGGFSGLMTEGRNPRTLDIDRLPTLEMLRRINAEDAGVAPAVALELPRIAEAVDRVAARMQSGGRLIYFGAGTSGRMGVLDASEVPPTYGLSPEWVVARIAGGTKAITQTVEESEDDAEAGAAEVAALNVGPRDSLVGIAASGRTPYVMAAMRAARERGALVISLACNRPAPMEDLADVAIAPLVGPEAVAGSTRMKAGTAQKMVLNMLSTGVMVRLGKTFSNLMVDMQASNRKLRARAVRMVALATGAPEDDAAAALSAAGGEVKTAIVALLAGIDAGDARLRLAATQGRVRAALEAPPPGVED